MSLVDIISIAGGIASIAQPIINWFAEQSPHRAEKHADIQKAYMGYKSENKLNCAVLSRIQLEKINTRKIGDPAVKDIAATLQTKAADTLLVSLFSLIQQPSKAVKTMTGKKLTKEEIEEAKKIITSIISAQEKIKELQCFTALGKEAQEIIGGFYVRARLKHIKEKSLYVKQRL